MINYLRETPYLTNVKPYNKEFQEKIHYDQLKHLLLDYYDNKSILGVSTLIEQIRIVEQFSLDSKRVICLFSNPDFYFKYISDNIENVIGYTPAEIYKGGLAFAYKLAYWKHLAIPLKIFQWGKKFESVFEHVVDIKECNAFFCGVKMKDKNGKLKTFFIKQKILSYDEKRMPLLSYMEIEDISNIYKKDFVWSRMVVKDEKDSYVRAFLSEGPKKEFADLISERELEVLKLVAQHKNSLDISEILNISKNTVERHRKNMIGRAGVTDMSSLLYVCRLCQLI